MTGSGPLAPRRVPTLTEVVSWPEPGFAVPAPPQLGSAPAVLAPPSTPPPSAAPPAPTPAPPAAAPLRLPEDQMIQGVLAEVQRQVDLMLDYRLREVLTPILNRASDGIVRDARAELASTLRDVVARAVAQELARHRTR